MKLGKKLANNKLFKFVKLLLKSKVFFKVQNKKNLVIFDNTSLEALKKYLLKDYDYFVIQNRIESANEFYLSPKILFTILKNYKAPYSATIVKNMKIWSKLFASKNFNLIFINSIIC